MNKENILNIIKQGENSAIEFKSAGVQPQSMAREIVAFLNTTGGIIIIGVEDDKQIPGIDNEKLEEWISYIVRNNIIPASNVKTSIVEIDNKQIGIIEIEKGVFKPYQTIDGKYWIRIGSTNRIATKEELSRLFQQAGLVHFDASHVENTSYNDLNLTKIHDYFSTVYQLDFLSLQQNEQEKILINTDILFSNNNTINSTIGGLLIFGKQPQKFLPQSTISFAAFRGNQITDELIDKKEINGTLPEIIDNTVTLINLLLPVASEIVGTKREEKILIPTKVLRETIVNAIAHRDYSIYGRKIMIRLFTNCLQIISPGRLPNTLTLEKIRYGNSAIRNHLIVKFLENLRYIDGIGRGIPLIIKYMADKVLFEEEGELFKVNLFF